MKIGEKNKDSKREYWNHTSRLGRKTESVHDSIQHKVGSNLKGSAALDHNNVVIHQKLKVDGRAVFSPMDAAILKMADEKLTFEESGLEEKTGKDY